MEKIVGILRPFDYKHPFYVYKDGNKVDIANPVAHEINSTIFALADKHGIDYIELTGPKQYVAGIVRKCKEEEMTKYNKNTLNIRMI